VLIVVRPLPPASDASAHDEPSSEVSTSYPRENLMVPQQAQRSS
jgi:hypothetical protein